MKRSTPRPPQTQKEDGRSESQRVLAGWLHRLKADDEAIPCMRCLQAVQAAPTFGRKHSPSESSLAQFCLDLFEHRTFTQIQILRKQGRSPQEIGHLLFEETRAEQYQLQGPHLAHSLSLCEGCVWSWLSLVYGPEIHMIILLVQTFFNSQESLSLAFTRRKEAPLRLALHLLWSDIQTIDEVYQELALKREAIGV